MIDARIHAIERELNEQRRECRKAQADTDARVEKLGAKIDQLIWGIMLSAVASFGSLALLIIERGLK